MLPGAVNRWPLFARTRSSRVWWTARACPVPSCCLTVATIIRDTSTGICSGRAGSCDVRFDPWDRDAVTMVVRRYQWTLFRGCLADVVYE